MTNHAKNRAIETLERLESTLKEQVARDPEQESQGVALTTLDAVIEDARLQLKDDPVIASVRGLVSPEAVEAGEPIRSADALIVVSTLRGRLGQRDMPRPSVTRARLDRRRV